MLESVDLDDTETWGHTNVGSKKIAEDTMDVILSNQEVWRVIKGKYTYN